MKKLTMNSLIKSTLKHRKKQYILMILGIVFAMMFSSGTLFFISSLNSTQEEMIRTQYGNCDYIIVGREKEEYDSYINGGYFSEYGVANIVGSMYSEGNEQTPVNIGYMDEKAKELYYPSFIDGEYPKNEGEIALEKSAITRIDPNLKVGDSFTVKFQSQNNGELMEKVSERTFKLTGILRTKSINISSFNVAWEKLPIAFVVSDKIMDKGAKTQLCYYMNFQSEEARFEFRTTDDNLFQEECIIDFDGTKYVSMGNGTQFGIVIFVLVLLVASLMIIVNAINANINERKKQIGMLRTVGATKRQIRKIFMRESLILTLISAPVSLLLSFSAIKAFAYFSKDDLVFVFDFWVLILGTMFGIASILIATVIPLLSASKISPVQSIRNIENMRAMKRKNIKSQQDFVVSELLAKRNLSFHKSKQIAVSLILAITIIFSSYGFGFLKQTLNFSGVFYYDYGMNDYSYTMDSGIGNRNVNAGFSENHRQDLKRIPGVKEVYGIKDTVVFIEKDEYSDYDVISQFNGMSSAFFKTEPYVDATAPQSQNEAYEHWAKEGKYEFSEYYYENKNYVKTEKEIIRYTLKGTKKERVEAIEKYVTDGKINYDKLSSGEEIILIAPEKAAYFSTRTLEGVHINKEIEATEDYKLIAESPYKAGDTLDIVMAWGDYDEEIGTYKNIETKRKQVKVGAIISELPDERRIVEDFGGEDFCLLTTNEGFLNFDSQKRYGDLYVELEGECDDEIDKEVMGYLESLSHLRTETYRYSKYQFKTNDEQSIKELALAMLSIIVLFCAIGISIINNSIASRIKASKREMGILRAVGATDKVLTLSYIKQLRSMFIWGISAGYIGYALSYAVMVIRQIEMYRIVKMEPNLNDLIPIVIWPSAIIVILYLGVCSLNLYLKIKKETKHSIIDNIREL